MFSSFDLRSLKVKADRANLRVVKTLSPSSRGAKTLAERHGNALICVRHRTDPAGKFRFITVELLVDRRPIKPRTDKVVSIRIGPYERSLQSLVRAAGALWDPEKKLWRMPKRVAGILNLRDRIVGK
ncbi:MAG: hypothetical protein KF892_24425 [Rhizobacter sp.]|nr:hypothetical protein [Rhizobacter sp.]